MMATIELTPEMVFERRDGASPSPSGPQLWNSSVTAPRPRPKQKIQGRGYHSLGSATLPTRGRKGGSNENEYGIMISIKDIKGHPFVILEDKEKHKHMVQAPQGEANTSALVSPTRLNGYTHEPEFDESILSSSDNYPPSSVTSGLRREATPSPVPRTRPQGSGRPFGRSHTLNNASSRSRSLSPGRAAAERRANRARSMSPPRRNRSAKRQVNNDSIKPVNSLIGYFETGSPSSDASSKSLPKPAKVNLLGNTSRIREITNRMKAERVTSPTSTVSSSISSSVDVSLKTQKTNLTVTTVDSPAKSGGKKPEGRYFAITSPGPLTPTNTFSLPRQSKPKTNNEKPEYLTLQARKAMFETKPGEESVKKTQLKPSTSLITKNSNQVQESPKKTIITTTPIKHENKDIKPVEESPVIPTHVSKAKFAGPSQLLLNKTKRKRRAGKLSMTHSESEFSESEYSDAESLKLGDEAFKDDDHKIDVEEKKVDNEVSDLTLSLKKLPDDEEYKKLLGHRKTPSIKFEKICSEDVTKKTNNAEASPVKLAKQQKLIDNLENEIDAANKRIRELEHEVKDLNNKLMSAEKDLNAKSTENGLLKKEVGSLKKDLEDALSSDEDEKQSVMALERLLKVSKREKTAVEETITLLESQKTTLKSQLQDAKRERENGEIEIRSLRHEIEKQKSRSGEHDRDVEGVRKELARSKRQSEAQICDMELQLTKAERKARDLQLEKSALEKSLCDLKHEKMASINEDKHVNEAMKQLEESKLKALQELEAAHAEVDDKARAFREADRKNNKLQEELRRMDKEMEEELEERESTLDDSRKVDQKLRDLTNQHQVANREIEMLKKELDDAKLKLKISEKKIDDLQSLIDQNSAVVGSLERNNKSLHKQLEENDIAKSEIDMNLNTFSRENDTLKKEISDLKKNLHDTEIELLASRDELDDLRKELLNATDKVKEERNKASDIDHDAEDLKKEYERVRNSMDQKELALRNAREAISKIETQMNDYEESRSDELKEKRLIETARDQAKEEMERLQDEVESQSERMYNANETIKDLQGKLADDMKSSLSDIEKVEEMKKEIQRLQEVVDEKTHQVFGAEETIYRQKEVIEEMSTIQQTAEKSALDEMKKFMMETEKQFEDVKQKLGEKCEEIKKLEKDKKDLEEELEELEQQHAHFDDDREKEEELVNLSQKLQEEEQEKREVLAKLHLAHDKLGNMQNELEIERSRVHILLEEKTRNKSVIEDLKSSAEHLEDKLEQEAKELANITSHHLKTEMKLRDILEQAEEETDKALNDKEMLVIRTEELGKHLEIAELAAQRAQNGKRDVEYELQQQLEANYKLQQTLAALGIGHSPSSSDGGKGSLLTSV